MVYSSLVDLVKISPFKNKRNHVIDTITIHCMAGNLTIERCGSLFGTSSASSNYGVGTDGRRACYVPEEYRSWCSSNAKNDHRAVTIEVANDGGASTGWHVSDKAMQSLIELLADICKRNGIKKLVWSTNKADRVNHRNRCNMTVHRDYANKACPGDYLYGKMQYIADEVNKRLGSGFDWSPVFDATYYATRYPDLRSAGITTPAQLLNHFVSNGMNERRQACDSFNVEVYRNRYPDLQKAFGDDWVAYYKHFCTNGKAEGRTAI